MENLLVRLVDYDFLITENEAEGLVQFICVLGRRDGGCLLGGELLKNLTPPPVVSLTIRLNKFCDLDKGLAEDLATEKQATSSVERVRVPEVERDWAGRIQRGCDTSAWGINSLCRNVAGVAFHTNLYRGDTCVSRGVRYNP
jgi:hypothetical protein